MIFTTFTRRISAAVLGAALAFTTLPASAAVYTFDLFDNPNGTETRNGFDYGLRLDYYGRIFSFDHGSDAQLSYDSDAGSATISGTVRESLGYNASKTERLFGDLWNLSYALTGLIDLGDGAFHDTAGNGVGSVTLGGETLALGAKANGSGTYFKLDDDGFRLPNGSPLFSGRGWVDPLDNLGGANDFLFAAELAPVPLPAAGWMLIAGLGGMGALRRFRKPA